MQFGIHIIMMTIIINERPVRLYDSVIFYIDKKELKGWSTKATLRHFKLQLINENDKKAKNISIIFLVS